MNARDWVIGVGLFALGLAMGGLMLVMAAPGESSESEGAEKAPPTRRVVGNRNHDGAARYLSGVSRRENLPRGFKRKRSAMKDSGYSPFRARAVLVHHIEDLDAVELEGLIREGVLETDEEVRLVFGHLAKQDPELAWSLCFESSGTLARKLIAMRTIGAEWGKQDPDALIAAIANSKTKSEAVVTRYQTFNGWVEGDPASYTQNYSKVAKAQGMSSAWVAERGFTKWFERDSDAALDFAGRCDDEEVLPRLLRVLERAAEE